MNRFTFPFANRTGRYPESMGLGRGFTPPGPLRFSCAGCKEQREIGGRRRLNGVWHCRHCAGGKA
jgi:hypothetical protein